MRTYQSTYELVRTISRSDYSVLSSFDDVYGAYYHLSSFINRHGRPPHVNMG